jgi:hypothetical protein
MEMHHSLALTDTCRNLWKTVANHASRPTMVNMIMMMDMAMVIMTMTTTAMIMTTTTMMMMMMTVLKICGTLATNLTLIFELTAI